MDWSLLWRKKGLVNYLLLPAAAVFSFAVMTRRRLYQSGFLRGSGGTHPPVVVVGNIVAGGGGKTPLVIALVEALKQRGLKPGIISRGFGGDYRGILAVSPDEDWRRCGDEALLLKRATGVPVCIGKRRCDAASHPDLAGCDLIISDDGLQHYALSRKVEICAVNGDFGVGNGWFLPAGPLRENYQRLQQCDFIVINRGVVGSVGANGFQYPGAYDTTLSVAGFYRLCAPEETLSVEYFKYKQVAALCALALPEMFFNTLNTAGVSLQWRYPLADHTRMDKQRLAKLSGDCIVMSEKDAIKYDEADKRLCAMKIRLILPSAFVDTVIEKCIKNS